MEIIKKRVLERPFNIPLGGLIMVLLFGVGAIGLQLPQTKSFLLPITPITLIITAILLFLGHSNRMEPLEFGYWAFVATTGFLIEMIGTNTGWPFGNYSYSTVLGISFWNTPLLIGLNWLTLLYCFNYLILRINWHWLLRTFLVAIAMAALDFCIEPVAIDLNFWQWEGNFIPISNYIAWFWIAFILATPFQFKGESANNPLLKWYIGGLSCFFILQCFVIWLKN